MKKVQLAQTGYIVISMAFYAAAVLFLFSDRLLPSIPSIFCGVCLLAYGIINYLYKDPEKNLRIIMDWADKFSGGEFPSQRKAIREAIEDPNHPYHEFILHMIRDTDPTVMKTLITNFFINANLIGWGNFLRKGSFLDMDYIYGVLSNSTGEDPLDYSAFMANPMEILMVAAEAESGRPRYFDKADIRQDSYDVLKASCAIPYVCRPQLVDGIPYYDGALSDPIPIEKAFELGCDRVILILTLPADTVRDSKKDRFLASRIRKKYPLAAQCLEHRAGRYNIGVAQAKQYEEQGKLLLVAPDNTCGVTTLEREPGNLARLYEKGYQDGHKIVSFIGE